MIADLCANCHYFRADQDGDSGTCHRRAPCPVLADTEPYVLWPVVEPGDWCGEYLPATPVQPAAPGA